MPNDLEHMTEMEASELLRDCAAGRLSDEVRVGVEAQAARSPALAEELAYYKGLVRAGQEPSGVTSPGELGWARLSRAMDEEAVSAAPPAAANDNMQIWKYAAFALGLVATLQAAFMFFPSTASIDGDAPIYTPVLDPSDRVRVTFVETATEADIRALLLNVDGEIVAGPSAIGLYELDFESMEERDAAMERLSAADSIIESASVNDE